MENSEKASIGSKCPIFASKKSPNVLYLDEGFSYSITLNWNEGIYDGSQTDEKKLTKIPFGNTKHPQHMTDVSPEVLLDSECWTNNNTRTLDKVYLRLDDSSLSPKGTCGRTSDVYKLKRSYLKNLIVLSFCFLLIFSAFFSLRNLQTSINRKDSLGLISLACMNAAFAAGCILANSIIQKVRPKRVIAVMLVGNSLYVASNFYPIFFTLIPATLFLGFTMANLLVAQSTYLTSIAVSYASAANKRPDHIISAFNGYFLFMMYLAHFIGNLLSSVVFHTFSRANSTTMQKTNESYIGSCSLILSPEKQNSIDENEIFVLLSIFMVITLQAHFIITIYLDKLDVIFYKSKLGLKNQIFEIWNLHLDPKMKFMLPLMAYLGFQEAFIYADFTNSYITCSIGLHMVGYAMMTFSAMDSISSFLCGYLRKFLAQRFMVAFGSVLNITTLLFLYYWKPSSDQSLPIFVIAAALGIVDGIWQTLTNSLCGILFSSRQRVSIFSSLRMYQAFGFTIASIYSHFLGNDIKIIIIMALLVVACFSFVGLEFQTSKTLPSKEYLASNNI